MNIFNKLKTLPNAPKSIFLDCSATPRGTWILRAEVPTCKIKIELHHCEFTAWLHFMDIDHDINCNEYSIEL